MHPEFHWSPAESVRLLASEAAEHGVAQKLARVNFLDHSVFQTLVHILRK